MDLDRLQTIAESFDPAVWVILGAIVLVLVLLGAGIGWAMARWRRRRRYEQRFGEEFERVRDESGDPVMAEAELDRREQRVRQFDIRPLTSGEYDHYATTWRRIQTQFVDDPPGATREADELVTDLMHTRGYPVGDFEQQANDLSVDHPRVVENYRAARSIADRNRQQAADTEDLRQALVYFRELFDDLLVTSDEPADRERRTVEAT